MESIPKRIEIFHKFKVVFRFCHCSRIPWELQISKINYAGLIYAEIIYA